MKIDPTVVLLDLDDKPIEDDQSSINITLGRAVASALECPYQDEQALSGADKLARHLLAIRLHKAKGPVEVTIEEAALIKTLVAKRYAPMISGQVWLLIEGAAAAPAQTTPAGNGQDKPAELPPS